MEWLKALRGKKSQYKVAEEAKISQSFYAAIETGKRKPCVAVAKRIAAVLGFDWTKFYEEGV